MTAPRRLKTKKSLSPPQFKTAKKEDPASRANIGGTCTEHLTFGELLERGRKQRAESPAPELIMNTDSSYGPAPPAATNRIDNYATNKILSKT